MKGTIVSWNNEKGFGFVAPAKSGDKIFVHISDFKNRALTPAVGQAVRYMVGTDKNGRPCAKSVTRPGERFRSTAAPGGFGFASQIALLFTAGLTLSWYIGLTPLVLLAFYAALSLITFGIYASDKFSAKKGRWRTPESVLHLWALAGGWPGAVAAQNILRHKSRKKEFRRVFWITTLVNLSMLNWLHTEDGASLLRTWTSEVESFFMNIR